MADLMTLEDVRDWHRGCEQAANADGHTNAASAHKELADAIDAAIKQREQDKKNVARYRWLRDGDNDLYVAKENAEGYAPEVFLGSDLDDELDITMTQENPNG